MLQGNSGLLHGAPQILRGHFRAVFFYASNSQKLAKEGIVEITPCLTPPTKKRHSIAMSILLRIQIKDGLECLFAHA